MSSRPGRFALPTFPALLALGALALAGCSGSADDAQRGASPDGPIAVTASDAACELSATTADAGTITFEVTNTGTKVTEFYVYGEGDRVVTELENITPGLSRELKVEIAEPGTFTTACKPGMVGDGIRGEFTVTGTATPGSADERVAAAIADYEAFLAAQGRELLAGTEAFVGAVKAGDVEKAKELYPTARLPWETIEPVAESFGDLDPRIDGREDALEEGADFTGYHRLEKDLWVDGLQDDTAQVADQLLADVREIVERIGTVEPTGLSIATGAKALLDEVATGKITGEEERYSRTDLWDFHGNVRGSRAALDALRPVLHERDAALEETLDARFAELEALLGAHRTDGRFVPYTELTDGDLKELSVALDALSEAVAQVPGVVATA